MDATYYITVCRFFKAFRRKPLDKSPIAHYNDAYIG